MNQWVDISFDCLPLRTISRFDIPVDASPRYRKRCEDILAAIKKHGSHNTYYLHNAECVYHLTNDNSKGRICIEFEGTVLTNSDDTETLSADLVAKLKSETCDWLTEPIVNWFESSVEHSVKHEFNTYIQAGDLSKAKQRVEEIESSSDQEGGYLGMYL